MTGVGNIILKCLITTAPAAVAPIQVQQSINGTQIRQAQHAGRPG